MKTLNTVGSLCLWQCLFLNQTLQSERYEEAQDLETDSLESNLFSCDSPDGLENYDQTGNLNLFVTQDFKTMAFL